MFTPENVLIYMLRGVSKGRVRRAPVQPSQKPCLPLVIQGPSIMPYRTSIAIVYRAAVCLFSGPRKSGLPVYIPRIWLFYSRLPGRTVVSSVES